MPGGNLHLPRLGARGVVPAPPGPKPKRQPLRNAVADRKPERMGPAVETLRGPVMCEPVDATHLAVPVRALLDAKPATCRYPFGPMDHLTFCGAKATVAAAGVLTYCEACARRMGWDEQAWRHAQEAMRPRLGGKP